MSASCPNDQSNFLDTIPNATKNSSVPGNISNYEDQSDLYNPDNIGDTSEPNLFAYPGNLAETSDPDEPFLLCDPRDPRDPADLDDPRRGEPFQRQEVAEAAPIDLEGGLLSDVKHCKKNRLNPDHHSSFIYAAEFGEEHVRRHFPEAWGRMTAAERAEAAACVRALAHWVVRINVPFVSPERLDKDRRGNPYLFANRKGQYVNAVGSGMIVRVRGQFIDDGVFDCRCGGRTGRKNAQGEDGQGSGVTATAVATLAYLLTARLM